MGFDIIGGVEPLDIFEGEDRFFPWIIVEGGNGKREVFAGADFFFVVGRGRRGGNGEVVTGSFVD